MKTTFPKLTLFFVLCISSSGLSYAGTSVLTEAEYYWELVFDYDNSTNEREIVYKYMLEESTSIKSREFVKKTLNNKKIYTYNNKLSTNLSFKGLKKVLSGSLNNTSTSNIHNEYSEELITSFETDTNITRREQHEQIYTIAGGSTLSLYRLVYFSNGVSVKTNIVATHPKPTTVIQLEYIEDEKVLGLSEFLDILVDIDRLYPDIFGVGNKYEWNRIKESIISNSHRDDVERFNHFVQVLRTTHPNKDNRVEWAAIRATANEIVRDWSSTDKQSLFLKLLRRLYATHPGKHNRVKWAGIRHHSNILLNEINER